MSNKTFRVEVRMTGPAFAEDAGATGELAFLLMRLATRILDDHETGAGDSHGPIRDSNGNLCGQWTIGVED